MINIERLAKPSIFENLDYDSILKENEENLKKLLPDWEKIEGDYFSILLEAFAYRELHLKAHYNEMSKAFFLSTTNGVDLENYAVLYGLQRLSYSYPKAIYTFRLDESQEKDIIIPEGFTLTDKTNTYKARLREEIIIKKNEFEADGTVELEIEEPYSDIETTIILDSIGYGLSVFTNEKFLDGNIGETDEELRERILTSMADKSTAGSQESYKSYTLKADEDIKDVSVSRGEKAGEVYVYYYAEKDNLLIKQKIENTLNAKDVRPLTDTVKVFTVEEKNYTVEANLRIPSDEDAIKIIENAKINLENELKKLKKIGVEITLSEINEFLRVDGVKDVQIISPTQNVSIKKNEIGIYNVGTIQHTTID